MSIDKVSQIFIEGLNNKDDNSLSKAPKSDRHNHLVLGYSFETYKEWLGEDIPSPPEQFEEFDDFIEYLDNYVHKKVFSRIGFEFSFRQALLRAVKDGVSILEGSVDAQMLLVYPEGMDHLIQFLRMTKEEVAPDLDFRPELGINRTEKIERLERWVFPLIETGYFTSIDLYNDEYNGHPKKFVPFYKAAKKMGMKLKAHSGEYGPAEFVRQSIEVLELEEVQHGNSVANDKEVMNWIRDNDIRLNLCPSSNVSLRRVENMKDHPIRTIADHGIRFTVNTDDILVFGQTINDEYKNLYNAGVFSAKELDEIRLAGLDR
jgi:adenosine deaminase